MVPGNRGMARGAGMTKVIPIVAMDLATVAEDELHGGYVFVNAGWVRRWHNRRWR